MLWPSGVGASFSFKHAEEELRKQPDTCSPEQLQDTKTIENWWRWSLLDHTTAARTQCSPNLSQSVDLFPPPPRLLLSSLDIVQTATEEWQQKSQSGSRRGPMISTSLWSVFSSQMAGVQWTTTQSAPLGSTSVKWPSEKQSNENGGWKEKEATCVCVCVLMRVFCSFLISKETH